jgi:hypothetical protein
MVNTKQLKSLIKIFTETTSSDMKWSEVESLLIALGADVTEGRGSRKRVKLNNTKLLFHAPHGTGTDKTLCQCGVRSIRSFLTEAGIHPNQFTNT